MSLRPVSQIIIHHSLTADGVTASWGAIERYHRAQGWKDIGYHAGVELIGTETLALIGRDWNMDAAAVKEGNMNHLGLHVCCVGNYDLLPPTEAMLDVLIHRILRPWMDAYKLAPMAVVGHHLFAPYKTCPGTQFDLNALRARL